MNATHIRGLRRAVAIMKFMDKQENHPLLIQNGEGS